MDFEAFDDENSTEQEVPYEFNGKMKENSNLDYMSPSESSETTFSESSTTLTSQDEQEEVGRAVPTSNRKQKRQKLLRQRKRRNRENHLISGVNLQNFMQTMLSTITAQKEATREINDQLTALKEQIHSQIITQQESTRKIFQYLLRMVEGEKHQENTASLEEIQSSLDKKKQCIQSLHTDLRKLVTEFHKQKLEMKMSSVKLTNCVMEKKELERLLTVAKEETHFYWEEYVRLRKQHLELLSKVRSKSFKKKYVNRKLCAIFEASKLFRMTLAEIKKVISRNPRVSKKLSNATGS
ncbi:uncharacterized protein LOC127527806 [Erpetoichthys calabaricus]|uniref:uncharacterized protein LOC127527806 n=1 Tax=Erpetoichthys calabaricus TaxID=27687 RepID=UPI002234062E|nr:uncharacterized protein LOC127527806 [Erpetoichthys calabaricus]